ncbi:MAG: PLP-dependent aminotransferase family protein, partial [Solirubrobacterales bacterium]
MAETISFARGAPSPDLIPVEAIRGATAKALEDDWKTALSYGVGIGHPGLCERIASTGIRSGLGAPRAKLIVS